MADNDSTIDLMVRTRADTSGLDKVDAALNKSEKSAQQLAAANPWASAGGGAWRPSPQFISQLDDFDKAQQKVSGSSRNLSNALLQGSRGIQDMQYGLAGAVNNLEGIASALGLGAGVAGAVTLVAVAVQTLGPHIAAWFKSLNTDSAALDATKQRLQASAAAILGEWTPATQGAKDAADAFAQKLTSEKAALDALESSLKTSTDLLRERAKLENDLAKNQEAQDIAAIKAKNLSPEDEAGQIATVKINRLNADKRRAEDLMTAESAAADMTLENKTDAAARAAQRQKQLADEKQRALLAATLDLEISGTPAQLDKDGKETAPAIKGAAERVADAEKAAQAARDTAAQARLGGVPEAEIQRGIQNTAAKAAQERQRLEDLAAERQQNIQANGGEQFRDIKTIDSELDKARGAAGSTAVDAEAARKARAELNQRQGMQRERLASDYQRDSGEILKDLPDDARPRAKREEGGSNPFEQKAKPHRDLYAEEKAKLQNINGGNDDGGDMLTGFKELAATIIDRMKASGAETAKLADEFKNLKARLKQRDL